jgi:cold shock CspA family protein
MENPLRKKLQNDPALLKQFSQHSQITNVLDNNINDATRNMLNNFNGNGNKNQNLDEPNNYQNSSQSPSPSFQNNNNGSNNNLTGNGPYQNVNQRQEQDQNQNLENLVKFQNQHIHQLQQYINQEQFQGNENPIQQNTDTKNYTNQNSLPNGSNTTSNNYTSQNSVPNGSNNTSNNSNGLYYDMSNTMSKPVGSSPAKRELGLVEKLVGSYGFVKCLDREGRLFFHYSSFQAEQHQQNSNNNDIPIFKVGDLIEFEEGTDKRNGKPIAINITKFQQNSQQENKAAQVGGQQQVDSLNMFNLNQLLKQNAQQQQQSENNGPSNNFYAAQNNTDKQQNYQTIMDGLKMLNIQSLKNDRYDSAIPAGGGQQLNPAVMNLFNKENIYSNNTNQVNLNQLNMNSNLLNMVKSATAHSNNGNASVNNNLNNLTKILNLNGISLNDLEAKKVVSSNSDGNDQMEGTIAIVATKRPITSQYNNRNSNFAAPQLDGRITYQRSGETFYIPYSLSDVVPTSPTSPMPNFNKQSQTQFKIGDRVRFYIAQSLGNDINPVGTYYARQVEPLSLAQQEINIGNNNHVTNNNTESGRNQMSTKQLYRGVITTLKESFGKIEREDQFKETFFHFHEYRGQNPPCREYPGHNPNQELKLGLNVEFELQDRYGKEIACNVKILPNGSVSFDELERNIFIGRITQPLTKLSNLLHNTNLNGINLNGISSIGKLIFDNNNSNSDESLTELLFSDLDRVPSSGNYTMLEGDFVQFRIATDKRKKNFNNNVQMHRQKRATQVTLIEEHSLVDNSMNTSEYRERGVLVKLGTAKELVPNLDLPSEANQFKYGAIKCMEQTDLVYFSLAELINYVKFTTNETTYTIKEVQLKIGDSLEFSVVKCQKDPLFKNGLQAMRVQQLLKNTVQFEIISAETYNGIIERDPSPITISSPSSSNPIDKNSGSIRFDYKNGSTSSSNKSVLFVNNNEDSEKNYNVGDKVQFNLSTCIKSKKQMAVNIKLTESSKEQGFITMLKDNYGFIELSSYSVKNNSSKSTKLMSVPRDIFFHYSSVQTSINDLDIGDEVEFKINRKTRGDQKICAESLVKLKTGTIKPNNISSTIYKGRIVQQLRSHNFSSNLNLINHSQEQHQSIIDEAYYGKVSVSSSKKDSNEASYDFGTFSLNDKKKCYQIGDLVTFQLGSFQDGVKKAFNLQLQQQQQSQQDQRSGRGNSSDLKKGKIDSMKGHCGFIEYSINTNNDLKKVFFHISDLTENYGNNRKSESSDIQIGDEVEFILMHNARSGKYSAIKIKKITASLSSNSKNGSTGYTSQLHQSLSAGKEMNEQTEATTPAVITKRPEHLITKLKIGNIDSSGKQLVLIRQPSKPDGKSFARELFERLPGSLEPKFIEKNDTEVLVDNLVNIDDKNAPEHEESNRISPLSIMDLIIANTPASN